MFARTPFLVSVFALLLSPTSLNAYFLTGEGHYGLKGFTQTKPAFQDSTGQYQATLQSFRLLTELKGGDNLSLKLDWGLFSDQDAAFLGENARPNRCPRLTESGESGDSTTYNPENFGETTDCKNYPQDMSDPGYAPYQPLVRQLWLEYSLESCLISAGRRPRHWGKGVFLNKGGKMFDSDASVFEGVTCAFNIQKLDNLQFEVGFDRLSETSPSMDLSQPKSVESDGYDGGASRQSDDLDQIFFSIEYNNRANQGVERFSRHIGLYFANVSGKNHYGPNQEEIKTDVKFADLYTAFYWPKLAWQNEVVFRLGNSGDASWGRYGGVTQDPDSAPAKSSVSSLAIAGDIGWTFSSAGAYVGPEQFLQGDKVEHRMRFEYAHAPGDSDGYRDMDSRRSEAHLSSSKKVESFAFHRNYKPAYLILSDNPSMRKFRIDGVYDPGRVMNMSLFSLGYEYMNLRYGDVMVRLVTAQLLEGMPNDLKDLLTTQEDEDRAAGRTSAKRPVGAVGKSLGYELNFRYTRNMGPQLSLEVGSAVGLPGDAWKLDRADAPSLSYLIDVGVGFKF
jgi:hypothetical protein